MNSINFGVLKGIVNRFSNVGKSQTSQIDLSDMSMKVFISEGEDSKLVNQIVELIKSDDIREKLAGLKAVGRVKDPSIDVKNAIVASIPYTHEVGSELVIDEVKDLVSEFSSQAGLRINLSSMLSDFN